MSEVRTIENKDAKEVKVTKKASNTKSLKELRLELQKLILDVRSGKEKNNSLIKKTRVDIARLLTNLRINNGQ